MASDTPITEGEFERFIKANDNNFAQVRELITTGFKGVHHRQDIANGRTGKNEQDIATLEERATRIEDIQSTIERIERDGCASSKACPVKQGQVVVLTPDAALPKQGSSLVNWKDNRVRVAGGIGVLAVIYSGIEVVKSIVGVVASVVGK